MSTAASQQRILVTGATGQQGGAVVRHLLKRNFTVRALTRDPNKPAAQALAGQGVELVQGDMNDRVSLDAAIAEVQGVFAVQNFWETGYDGEVAQGKHLADAARAGNVQHFVYSSVGSAQHATGIPHFDSKWEVEQHVRSLGLPYTILRPVFFMDNWQVPMLRDMIMSGQLMQPLSPETKLQQIAVDDIGAFAAMAFEDRDAWLGRELDIAGDELSMTDLVATFGRVIGKSVTYQQVEWDAFEQQMGPEYTVMYRWFENVGYSADIAALREAHPDLKTLEQFLREHNWQRTAAA